MNLNCARFDGSQGVRYSEFAIVMGVYADLNRDRSHHRGSDLGDFMNHRAAVRVAQYDDICTTVHGSPDRRHRVLRIVFIPIKKMFRVKKDLFTF